MLEINRINPLETAKIWLNLKRIYLKGSYFPVSFSLYAAGKLDEHEGLPWSQLKLLLYTRIMLKACIPR